MKFKINQAGMRQLERELGEKFDQISQEVSNEAGQQAAGKSVDEIVALMRNGFQRRGLNISDDAIRPVAQTIFDQVPAK